MTAEDVEIAIIQPMLATLPPPTYLRGVSKAIEIALSTYRLTLAKFDRPVLEQAWHKAVSESAYRIWPSSHSILKAAEHYQRISQKGRNPDRWVDEAMAMAENYAKKYMRTSQAAAKAREGGYEPKLREFVRESAWVQAQALIGRRGLAYTGTVLFQNGEDAEERQGWIAKAREQAESGFIRVHVPPALLRKWKERAEKADRIR